MKNPEPVSTVDLFEPLSRELVALLRGLSPEDWERPTVAGSWRVRDVAAHLLDTDLRRLSMRALPHAFREVEAPEKAAFVVAIPGDAGGVWTLVRGDGRWSLWVGEESEPAARVRLDAETAWKIFYNALPPEAAAARMEVEGDPRLGAAFLRTRSVMV